jgi:altronate dehydratase
MPITGSSKTGKQNSQLSSQPNQGLEEELDKMIHEIHDIIRSACAGQLCSVPLAFLVGSIQGTGLAGVAAIIANPATVSIFALSGIAMHQIHKLFKALDRWEAERQEEIAVEAVINQLWESSNCQELANSKKKKSTTRTADKKVVDLNQYRNRR